MGYREDLGLSLGLSSAGAAAAKADQTRHSLQLNLMPTSSWNDGYAAASGGDRSSERSFLRGIDVNRMPSRTVECEEEAGVSSPNSTISTVSGKRSSGERGEAINGEENDVDERACSRGISDEEDADTSRKKLRLSKDQSAILEDSFKEHNTLNPKQKLALAKQLNLRPRQVEVWFQNRRARTKLKQTEVDCEFLKRCCENLTEENRRLQKEVQELRALKLSPQFYMHMTPPTTLTMCPSCERVAVSNNSSAAGAGVLDAHHHHQHQQPHQPHRAIPINPWAAAAMGAPPVGHRPLDLLRPRS
ncbi:hypothetical protein Sjap_004471 [Stephania japonica]|uniref:Homeobox domain-containing protein n=1 Tax=Stephania japonica TaxID=461633 RepID=A0AAP0K2B2_9MAGN